MLQPFPDFCSVRVVRDSAGGLASLNPIVGTSLYVSGGSTPGYLLAPLPGC